MVEKYIKDLLDSEKSVIVPGLGDFFVVFNSAKLDKEKGLLSAPSELPGFNESNIVQSNSLVEYIAEKENVSFEDAKNFITEFVKSVRAQLISVGSFSMNELGTLILKDQVEFQPAAAADNLRKFPEIKLSHTATLGHSERESPLQFYHIDDTAQEERSGRIVTYISLAFLLLLSGTAAATIFLKNSEKSYPDTTVEEYSDFPDDFEAETVPLSDSLGDSTSASPDLRQEEVQASEPKKNSINYISEKTGNYYLIAGSFRSKKKADATAERLAAEGAEVTVIEPKRAGNLYKVAVAQAESNEKAVEVYRELWKKFGKDIWVFKY